MWLADTTFIIDLVNADSGAVSKAKEIDQQQVFVNISTITVQEYLRGVYYLFGHDSKLLTKKLTKSESDLVRFHWIAIDYKIAKLAAMIDADLTKKGTKIGYADVLIGSTALFYGLNILTRNLKHFSQISNLQIEHY